MRKLRLPPALTMLLATCLVLNLGCSPGSSEVGLPGVWECRDLSPVEHRATDDLAMVMIFKPKGQCNSYITSTRGEVRDKTVASYTVERGILVLSFKSSTSRFYIQRRGDTLYLRFIDVHPETRQSRPLVFKRLRGDEAARRIRDAEITKSDAAGWEHQRADDTYSALLSIWRSPKSSPQEQANALNKWLWPETSVESAITLLGTDGVLSRAFGPSEIIDSGSSTNRWVMRQNGNYKKLMSEYVTPSGCVGLGFGFELGGAGSKSRSEGAYVIKHSKDCP